MSEQNKAVYRRSLSEVVSKGNYDVIPEVVASDWVSHMPGEDIRGHGAMREMLTGWRKGFPDVEITVDD